MPFLTFSPGEKACYRESFFTDFDAGSQFRSSIATFDVKYDVKYAGISLQSSTKTAITPLVFCFSYSDYECNRHNYKTPYMVIFCHHLWGGNVIDSIS